MTVDEAAMVFAAVMVVLVTVAAVSIEMVMVGGYDKDCTYSRKWLSSCWY